MYLLLAFLVIAKGKKVTVTPGSGGYSLPLVATFDFNEDFCGMRDFTSSSWLTVTLPSPRQPTPLKTNMAHKGHLSVKDTWFCPVLSFK